MPLAPTDWMLCTHECVSATNFGPVRRFNPSAPAHPELATSAATTTAPIHP